MTAGQPSPPRLIVKSPKYGKVPRSVCRRCGGFCVRGGLTVIFQKPFVFLLTKQAFCGSIKLVKANRWKHRLYLTSSKLLIVRSPKYGKVPRGVCRHCGGFCVHPGSGDLCQGLNSDFLGAGGWDLLLFCRVLLDFCGWLKYNPICTGMYFFQYRPAARQYRDNRKLIIAVNTEEPKNRRIKL